MVSRRPTSWFLTETGRQFTFGVITTTGIALSASKLLPHTIFLDKYKEFAHYYSNGLPVELPKELRERYQKCLDLLDISNVHRKLVSPFSVFGYDLFHAGSTSSKFGVAVGIPVNFTYKSLSDLQGHDIKVNQKEIDWNSESGKKLANALILPEKVQQFAICREILMAHNKKVMFEAVYPFTSIFLIYNFTHYMNHRLKLYLAPLLVRASLYTITGLFGIGLYFLLKDMTEVHYETEVDKKLCSLGIDFIECGVIFYQKLLERNQALRELMGKEGEKKYSKLGNENFFLRQPRLALVHRKQYFESQLKEHTKENTSESSNIL